MADNISMKQVPAGTVTATDDRILYDCLANGSCGVLYGCEIAYTGNNMIHINAGYGIIKGGLFEIEDHTEYVDYAESGVVKGQIYLHFDAAADDKLIIVKETTDQAHILEQDVNANYDSGVYEIQLCTFNATQTTLENVTQTFPVINGSVLDSLEEIMANTAPGLAAGALAVKSLNNNFVFDDTTGYLKGYKTGADTWSPFKSSPYEYTYIVGDGGTSEECIVNNKVSGPSGFDAIRTMHCFTSTINSVPYDTWGYFTKPFDLTTYSVLEAKFKTMATAAGCGAIHYGLKKDAPKTADDCKSLDIVLYSSPSMTEVGHLEHLKTVDISSFKGKYYLCLRTTNFWNNYYTGVDGYYCRVK